MVSLEGSLITRLGEWKDKDMLLEILVAVQTLAIIALVARVNRLQGRLEYRGR